MARKKTAATKKKQAGKLHTSANRKYKDTVFRMLFADKSNLLSLYNAMSGSDYHDPSKLQIITLENAIYIRYEKRSGICYRHKSVFIRTSVNL